ncbi:hypothetical protein ACFYNL_35550 [Streptomyces sp. NPDC007808]|uniref:hypothetical protein n=1 Tax=Streptomyces sp. NPDC007808 TaxID=3364779 RepID=UPI00367641DF
MRSRRINALMAAAALVAALLTLAAAPAASSQERICAVVDVADVNVQVGTGSGPQDDCVRVDVL